MLNDPKTDETTGIEEVKVPTTGIEKFKTPVTGILEARVPTTGIEEFKKPEEPAPDITNITPSKPSAEMPKGSVSFSIDKEFRVGQRLWHPTWHETGIIIAEENFRGNLLLVESGKPSEAYNTTHHGRTTLFLTVDFEKMGKRRLACNIERSR